VLRFSLIFVVAWISVAGYTAWSGKYLQPVLGPIPFGDPVGARYSTPALPKDRYNFLFLIHHSDHDASARISAVAQKAFAAVRRGIKR
jgi:hypothetical protein